MILRTLVYLLLTILLITFLRAIVGLIGKAVAQLFQPTSPGHQDRDTTARKGELKQCPACGVYTSTSTALKTASDGKDLYFCSAACRDKHQSQG